MKSMKERITIICIISILLCALSSVAFSTSEGTAENIISFGRLKIQPINNRMDENGEEVSVTTEEEKLNGNQVSRIIKVKNICEHPVYVRVKIEFSGEDKQGKFQAGEYVSFQDPTGEWVKHGEWYYHSKALEQDQVTGNLFEELIFDLDRLKTDHAGSKIEFVVSAQAVQSENNGTSAETANGWPKEAE